MNLKVFQELYLRRITYPIGVRSPHENVNDKQYINDEISRQSGSNYTFLLLTETQLDKVSASNDTQKLLGKLKIVGIFNVGAIFDPFTSINFNLNVFSSEPPHKIWFGELTDGRNPFKKQATRPQLNSLGMMDVEARKEEKYFSEYLESINLAINDGKKDDYVATDYRIFGADASKMTNRLNIDYYKPELIEVEAKLAHEKTARLGDLAEIIYPRGKIDSEVRAYSIKLATARYPLDNTSLMTARDNVAAAKLQKGDILTNSFLNSAYLNMTERDDLFATNTQIIIRVNNGHISREFLTVYLNSERMHAYFKRRSAGAIMPRLSRADLADFPVVLPSINEQSELVSSSYLKSLGEMREAKDRMAEINKVLFSTRPSSRSPLQSEIFKEMRDVLLPIKNVLVRELFDSDLSEVEKCYNAGAYKGCLVMCGAILEALVLDWLSELEGKDYFDPTINTQLKKMINILKDAAKISAQEAQTAHDIRNYRNLIHPQKSIENMPISRDLCKKVIDNLKPIVSKRYRNA